MTDKIPTAREFYDSHYSDDCVIIMIEFAKLHVEVALKAASEKADLDCDEESDDNGISVNKDSILKAYPLTNIK
jgi:hypothetical protein